MRILFVFLMAMSSTTLKASEYEIDEIIDNLNRLCLVSTNYSIKASGGLNVKLFKSKGISGSGEYVETDINGLLQNLQGEMAQKELSDLRRCIDPYRTKIMSKLLGEDVSSLVTETQLGEEISSILSEKCPEARLALSESLYKLYPKNEDILLLIGAAKKYKDAYYTKKNAFQKHNKIFRDRCLVNNRVGLGEKPGGPLSLANKYYDEAELFMENKKYQSAILKYNISIELYKSVPLVNQ